ncbi:MAG TPA: ATP-binding protein [Polyangia bacterium]
MIRSAPELPDFDLIDAWVVILDGDGRILGWNRRCEELTGESSKNVAGKSFSDLFFSTPESEPITGRLAAASARQAPLRFDAAWRGRDGARQPIAWSLRAGDSEEVWVATGIAGRLERDQRFIIEAGRILAGSLDFDKTLTEVAELAVKSLADCCMIDIVEDDGRIRRLRVAVADPKKREVAAKLRGYPHGRSRSLPPFARLSLKTGVGTLEPELSPAFLESIAEDAEHLALLREIAPRSSMSLPLIARERMLGAIVFLSSGRRYDEEDLRLARDLTTRSALAIDNARVHALARRALVARDAILGVVAHDLRNPLNAIVLSTQLLAQRLAKEGRPHTGETDTILHAARRLNRLTADLLDVTRIEAGTLSIEPQRQSGSLLFSAILEMARPLLTGFELVVEAPAELPEVVADRDRILQVFSNLVGNAIKFTPAGGRITLGASAGSREVTFRLTDSGCGVSPEDQLHLFDRFWQADQHDRRGMGLGLPIAKGIVLAHGGTILVKSVIGEGSTFACTLPIAA